jgi:transposase
LGCHQNAFDWFGAVPGKIMVDRGNLISPTG